MTMRGGSRQDGIPGRSVDGRCSLLVSVRDAAEAEEAVAGGATIIDVKEPRRGPLGPADCATAARIASVVGGRVPWTMACGELRDGIDAINGLVRGTISLLGGGTRPPAAAKAGLAGTIGDDWRGMLAAFAGRLPAGMEPVAVAYADWRRASAPPPHEVIAWAGEAGYRWLLVDTFDKTDSAIVRDAISGGDAVGWVARARATGMRVVLAGSLSADTLPAAVACGPDVIAVRSAACVGGRFGTVCGKLVHRLGRLCGPAGLDPATGDR